MEAVEVMVGFPVSTRGPFFRLSTGWLGSELAPKSQYAIAQKPGKEG